MTTFSTDLPSSFQPRRIMGAEVVACARSYLGAPYRHQGSTRAGLDCSGLAQAVAKDLGQLPADFERGAYSQRPSPRLFTRLAAYFDLVADGGGCLDLARDGDLLLLCHSLEHRQPAHLAFKTPAGMLHIHPGASLSRVCEHSLGDDWVERVLAVHRLRGVCI